MDKIGNIFGNNKRFKVLNQVKASSFINRTIKEKWGELLGGNLSKDIKFCYVKDKTLMMSSKNPAWATEIEFFRPEILHRISKYLGKGKVKDIKFLPYSEERAQGKKYKKRPSMSLEDQIISENKRKRKLNYLECPSCHTLWKPRKECLFCSTTL